MTQLLLEIENRSDLDLLLSLVERLNIRVIQKKGKSEEAGPPKTDELLSSNSEAISTLKKFYQLPPNWDSYDALPPSPEAIREAEDFVRQLNGLREMEYFVSPGPNGNVLVEMKTGSRSVEFHFYPDKNLRFVCFDGKEFVRKCDYSPADMEGILKWLQTNP